ncbi:MAG TPA: methyltransferase domain-containing protein [Planctomycetota bacterium]|nr:methyltransferase domain-containing protein [Planctomycetota bacterium]
MDVERSVAAHYAREGLETAILEALASAGRPTDPIDPADLAPLDEFHLGWAAITTELVRDLGFGPDAHVLDVGSGLGGPARHFARACGCRVSGVDLTEAFVGAAQELTRRTGQADRVAFRVASALELPFPDGTFDGAMLLHVGMNIADKAKLFAEVRRVLRPRAPFCVYDLMRTQDAPLPYPMPWAATEATSFVATPAAYRDLLSAAGFRIEAEKDRSAFVLARFAEMRARAETEGKPPVGLHLIMGTATQERLGNAMAAVQRGQLAPIEMIARAL